MKFLKFNTNVTNSILLKYILKVTAVVCTITLFLVLSTRWACFSLQCLLLGHLTSQLSLRCPADCDSWFVSCTWCHLWFTNARHSHSGVLAAQVVHFNKGVLICILLGKASATVAASLWADDGMASIVWSQRPLLAYHGLAKLVVWARVFLT